MTNDDDTRPDGPVEEAVAELLGVRDDLGDVCAWLQAEWPADLPAPYVAGRTTTRGNAAELWVQCSTAETLARAAAALGVEVEDDLLPGGYRCAVRRFGRVDLLAWRKLPALGDEVAY